MHLPKRSKDRDVVPKDKQCKDIGPLIAMTKALIFHDYNVAYGIGNHAEVTSHVGNHVITK